MSDFDFFKTMNKGKSGFSVPGKKSAQALPSDDEQDQADQEQFDESAEASSGAKQQSGDEQSANEAADGGNSAANSPAPKGQQKTPIKAKPRGKSANKKQTTNKSPAKKQTPAKKKMSTAAKKDSPASKKRKLQKTPKNDQNGAQDGDPSTPKKKARRHNMNKSLSNIRRLQREAKDISKLVPHQPFVREVRDCIAEIDGDPKAFNLQSEAVDMMKQHVIEQQLHLMALSKVLLQYRDAKMLTQRDYETAVLLTAGIPWHKISQEDHDKFLELVKNKPASKTIATVE